MAALLASIGAGSTAGAGFTTGGIDTTGATFLQITVTSYHSALSLPEPTPTDSASNTWTQGELSVGANCRTRTWFVNSNTPNTSSSHTASLSASGYYASLIFAAFDGTAAAPLDQGEHLQTGTSTTTNCCPPVTDLMPSQDNSLITAAIGVDDVAGTFSIDSGMTIATAVPHSPGNHFGSAVAWKQQTTATAIDPIWSWTNSVVTQTMVESWKPGAAPPASVETVQTVIITG